MEHQPSVVRHFAAITTSGRKLIIRLTSVPLLLHTIITIILRNIINSLVLLTLEIPSITTVVAQSHLHTDVCKRAYHLPSKRPRWWMKITIQAITINWIQSIIQSEATQGDNRSFSQIASWIFISFSRPIFCLPIEYRCDMYNQQLHQHAHSATHTNGMNSRSRSVPEGLAHPNGDVHWNNNRTIGPNFYRTQSRQPLQVLEQITTSVWRKINLQNLLICFCVYVLEAFVAFAA